MDGAQIIKAIMKDTGITQVQLAAMTGRKNQSNVSESLKRDMRAAVLAEFADALGYEVVVRKKKAGRKEDGSYVVGKGD